MLFKRLSYYLADFPAVFFLLCHGTQMNIQVHIYVFFYLLQPLRGCKGMYLFTTISHHHCTALVPQDLSNTQYFRSLIEVVEVVVLVRMEVV